jgi:hypothetical protein
MDIGSAVGGGSSNKAVEAEDVLGVNHPAIQAGSLPVIQAANLPGHPEIPNKTQDPLLIADNLSTQKYWNWHCACQHLSQ